MPETSHIMLQGAATQLTHELTERIENEWHTGDEYEELVWKRDRLRRFKEYVELHRQFTPK